MPRNQKSSDEREAPAKEKNDRKKRQVLLEVDVARDVNHVCGILQISAANYVNSRIGPKVAEELLKLLAEQGFKRN